MRLRYERTTLANGMKHVVEFSTLHHHVFGDSYYPMPTKEKFAIALVSMWNVIHKDRYEFVVLPTNEEEMKNVEQSSEEA